MIKRAGLKPHFGHTEITTQYISKPPNYRQTQPKWNLLGLIDTKVVISCY